MKRFLVLAGLMAVCGLVRAQWIQTTGPTGGVVKNLTVLGSTVFAATEYSGVFYSNDYGNNWTRTVYGTNNGLPVYSFAVAGTVIYGCGYNELFISPDQGYSWETIQIPQGSGGAIAIYSSDIYIGGEGVKGVFRCSIGDTSWVSEGLQGISINSLSTGAGAIWAGTNDGVWRSQGGVWARVLGGTGFDCMAFSGTTIFAGSHNDGVFASENNGVTWTLVESGARTAPNTLLIAGNEIYAGCWNGIYKSSLSGNINWTQVCNGLDFYRVYSLAYAGNIIFAGVCGGVYVSRDGGGSWSRRNSGLIGTNCLLRSRDGRMIARANPNGFWYTTNKGDDWTEISNGLNRYDHVLLELHDLTFGGSTYYAGTEAGVYHSVDQGSNWICDTAGLTSGYVYALAVAGSTLFAGTANGVFRADKNVLHFSPFTEGMPSENINVLLTVADTDIWVGTCGNGIFHRGISGAEPWKAINNGIGDLCVNTIAGDPSCMFTGTHDGFYRSYNQGASWEKIENPWFGRVSGIAVKGDTVIVMSDFGIWYSKTRGSSFSDITSLYFFGGPSILIGDQEVFVGTTDVGVWKRAWSDIHTFHLTVDSVVLNPTIGSRDSLYIECDTNWSVQGYMPEFLSANRLTGKGDGYVVFTALQSNTNDYELVNAFELHSATGQVTGFSVHQLGKSYGFPGMTLAGLTVYPNPSQGEINITAQSPLRSIDVYTAQGILVREIQWSGSATHTSLCLPGRGIYFVRVITVGGKAVVKVVRI